MSIRSKLLPLLFFLSLPACGQETSMPHAEPAQKTERPYIFHEFPWAATEPDTRNHRLCREAADPDGFPDTLFIHCEIEGGRYAPATVPPKDRVVIAAYNVERGFKIEKQIALFRAGSDVPRPDVILVSEADRGCARTDFRSVMHDFARALGMYYVYGVEFVEIPDDAADAAANPLCEHGNGILSRYPLGNVRVIRFANNSSWYANRLVRESGRADEPRLGGRMAITADMKVGARMLHLYAAHLESKLDPQYREKQAEELALDALNGPFHAVIGGDTNSPFYFLDIALGTDNDATTQAFLKRGFQDAHAAMNYQNRVTVSKSGGDFAFVVIDEIFGTGPLFSHAGVCSQEACGELSDHLPIYTTVDLTVPVDEKTAHPIP